MSFYQSTLGLLFLSVSCMAWGGGNHAGGHHHHDGASIGEVGMPEQVSRTVVVTMADTMRFSPARIQVQAGETLEIVVRNTGKVKHEMVLGTASDLKAHAALMKQHPGMEHADDNMLTLAPGAEGRLLWRFSQAGKVQFACLQPGHYEAGMKGVVHVKPLKAS